MAQVYSLATYISAMSALLGVNLEENPPGYFCHIPFGPGIIDFVQAHLCFTKNRPCLEITVTEWRDKALTQAIKDECLALMKMDAETFCFKSDEERSVTAFLSKHKPVVYIQTTHISEDGLKTLEHVIRILMEYGCLILVGIGSQDITSILSVPILLQEIGLQEIPQR